MTTHPLRIILFTALLAMASTAGHAATPLPEPPAAIHCHANGAQYRLLADPDYRITLETATEANAASDLHLRLHTPAARYSFAFAISNGYGQIRLLPLQAPPATDDSGEAAETTAPLFHAFADDMGTLDDPPQAGATPPSWLFIPDLGPALWYELLAGDDGQVAPRTFMPASLFRLESCRP